MPTIRGPQTNSGNASASANGTGSKKSLGNASENNREPQWAHFEVGHDLINLIVLGLIYGGGEVIKVQPPNIEGRTRASVLGVPWGVLL